MSSESSAPVQTSPTGESAAPLIAYIGQGRLMLLSPGKPAQPVESAFCERIEAMRERDRERHSWKNDSMGWNTSALPREAGDSTDGIRDVRFTSVASYVHGKLLYSIATSHVGGLFRFDPKTGEEQRMIHKSGLRAEALASNPHTGEITFCARHDDGSCSIGTVDAGGGRHQIVTEGDSIDEAPSWSPQPARRIVLYQSAGIARNRIGRIGELSCYRIESLDLDEGKGETIVEDSQFDYLCPRMMPDGSLLAIKRPWRSLHSHGNFFTVLKDTLLFPFRLLMTIAAVFNIISTFARGKPMYSTSGGPGRKLDATPMFLWGRWVQTRKTLSSGKTDQPLVPKDWILVRRNPDGTESTLAEHALHFDVDINTMSLCYTDGSRIMLMESIDSPQSTTEVGRGKLIERVAMVSK